MVFAPPLSGNLKNEGLIFYYAKEDGPHYQVFSLKKDHVLKHYPNGTINQIEVSTIELTSFIEKFVGSKLIELLAIDIEGIDAEILLGTNWKTINLQKLSFEYIHLGSQINDVDSHLRNCGFIPSGKGVDINGIDLMYTKVRSLLYL